MQLSKFSDYALRVLMHLTASPDNLMSTRQIAEMHEAKYNHLTKVTAWLVGEGYAASSRGRGGGLRLALDPSEINLGKLIRSLEADRPLVDCHAPDGGTCPLAASCGLSMVLQDAQEAFFVELEKYSIKDTLRVFPSMTKVLTELNDNIRN
ncbi:MAG: Rrf2 family transcriptional regulator [Tateyamaria sp.]|uniref:RrF2 family transcriptional regulator n=1 Tax=Tateyamaria sp. TaxID=1929288 RepID=UPI00327CEDA2